VRPDLVFTRARVAVFVDGCFWHSCPEHGDRPRINTGYWLPKLEANVARDRRVDRALTDDGWDVVRIWEHEDPLEAAARVRRSVARARRRAG
jgi:DNA mismatch endonuclease (patch repair protein)